MLTTLNYNEKFMGLLSVATEINSHQKIHKCGIWSQSNTDPSTIIKVVKPQKCRRMTGRTELHNNWYVIEKSENKVKLEKQLAWPTSTFSEQMT